MLDLFWLSCSLASCRERGGSMQGAGNSGLARTLKKQSRSVTPGNGQICTWNQTPRKGQGEEEMKGEECEEEEQPPRKPARERYQRSEWIKAEGQSEDPGVCECGPVTCCPLAAPRKASRARSCSCTFQSGQGLPALCYLLLCCLQ